MEEAKRGRDLKRTDLPDKFEPFPGADVPFPLLLDLSENPRLDERASADHHTVDAAGFDVRPVVVRRETVAAAKNWHGWYWQGLRLTLGE